MGKRMRSVVALIGFASAACLLLLGIEVLSDTSVAVWSGLNSLPLGFFRFISDSFSHQWLWTAGVLAGIVAAIFFVRGVPPAKAE
jgi:hypothetical protein